MAGPAAGARLAEAQGRHRGAHITRIQDMSLEQEGLSLSPGLAVVPGSLWTLGTRHWRGFLAVKTITLVY